LILDTNALSAVADDDSSAVRLFREATSIELPVIVLGEYRFGIAHSRRRNEYEKWLDELMASTRILSVDEETSGLYAQVRAELKKAGQPIPSNGSADGSTWETQPAAGEESSEGRAKR